jgi:reactive intermediate/imine deaminase
MREIIRPPGSPDWGLPLAAGVATESLIFVGGHTALEEGNRTDLGDIGAQTRRVLDKIAAVLVAGGASLTDVVQTTVWLSDRDDFTAMNEVYAAYFDASPPARSTVVSMLVYPELLVEINAIAVRPASAHGDR